MHMVSDGPRHKRHAAWQGAQAPVLKSGYRPSAHRETHELPSRIASTWLGQLLLTHALRVQLSHSLLRGPVHDAQEEWHGWQTRSSSSYVPIGHCARHWPSYRCACGPYERQLVQRVSVTPAAGEPMRASPDKASHITHDGWQGAHAIVERSRAMELGQLVPQCPSG